MKVKEPVFIYGDNQSVLTNSTIPTSQLQKKSNSVVYHFVRKCSVRDEWRTTYYPSNDNTSDLITKPLFNEEKKNKHMSKILWINHISHTQFYKL